MTKRQWVITYEQGNGYFCSCCRQTWETTEDYEDLTEEEMVIQVAEECATDCDNDKVVETIRAFPKLNEEETRTLKTQIKSLTMTRQVEITIEKERQKHIENEKKKELAAIAKEKRDREEYERLKAKYE